MWLGAAVLASVALVGSMMARRRHGHRQIDAGSVSARWLSQAKWERNE
jgi:hypothetical protein